MAHFDRYDICEAYLALEWDWHDGGWIRERPRPPSRQYESIGVQLERMKFRAGAGFRGYESLSDNGKEIYHEAEMRLFGKSTRKEMEESDDADRS